MRRATFDYEKFGEDFHNERISGVHGGPSLNRVAWELRMSPRHISRIERAVPVDTRRAKPRLSTEVMVRLLVWADLDLKDYLTWEELK